MINIPKTDKTREVIVECGFAGNSTKGLKPDCFSRGGRISVESYNRVLGYSNKRI